jgi:hypothetical protein
VPKPAPGSNPESVCTVSDSFSSFPPSLPRVRESADTRVPGCEWYQPTPVSPASEEAGFSQHRHHLLKHKSAKSPSCHLHQGSLGLPTHRLLLFSIFDKAAAESAQRASRSVPRTQGRTCESTPDSAPASSIAQIGLRRTAASCQNLPIPARAQGAQPLRDRKKNARHTLTVDGHHITALVTKTTGTSRPPLRLSMRPRWMLQCVVQT